MGRGSTMWAGWRGRAVVAAALVAGLGRSAAAQFSSMQVSGSPATMRIVGSTAGAAPAPVVESSTTYTFANRNGTKKITAQLNTSMPAGVTLAATFEAPTGATTLPNVPLDATARDVVTGIGFAVSTTNGITYTLSATPAAGVVPQQSRTVTLTLVTAP